MAVFAVVGTVVAVVQATHGLILLVPLAGGGALWWKQQHDAQQRRELAAQQEQHRLWQAGQLRQLYSQHPRDFELTTRDVLAAHGYRLQHAGRTNDRGVDLVGSAPNGAPVIVQCKRYGPGRTVGGPDVRALIGAMAQARAHHGLLVTTATFTREATVAAQGQRITLVDGAQLVAMARRPPAPPAVPTQRATTDSSQPWWRRV